MPTKSSGAPMVFISARSSPAHLLCNGDSDRSRRRRCRRFALSEVAAEARMFVCAGGSPGAALIRANLEQLRDALIDGGYVTRSQFAEDIAALDRPDFVMPSSILWSVRGRRPSTS